MISPRHPAAIAIKSLLLIVLPVFAIPELVRAKDINSLPAPADFQVLPRQLCIHLQWNTVPGVLGYEVARASVPDGPFTTLPNESPALTIYNDFIGVGHTNFYYHVRALKAGDKGRQIYSDWSPLIAGHSMDLDSEQLLTEVQQASFDYFYSFGHPASGLARISLKRDPDICAIGASGMGFFNLGVGIERGFITRDDGAARTLKELRFLSTRADRFHGAFPHLINGQTGKVIPFSKYDDGADIVETAFLMEGVLFAREYFSGSDTNETEIRTLANGLWHDVQWDWFVSRTNATSTMIWHWSPQYGWKINLPITGFNECQIVYVLGLASPTHPIDPAAYWQGWEYPGYSADHKKFGIHLELGSVYAVAPPLFMAHLSYLGLDPHQLQYRGRSYFDHFTDFCRVQILYADSKSNVFKGYGPVWGITASAGPEGYRAFSPGLRDNGTIAPTAALSSMPYVPKESLSCLVALYQNYGSQLWGPFGFYDSFNLTRNWVSKTCLCIDEAPIAPMIENYRSALCWKIFMKCPELPPVLKLLNDGEARLVKTK